MRRHSSRTVSTAQAARVVGVSDTEIRNMARRGELRIVEYVRGSGSPAMRFDPEQVAELGRLRSLPKCGFCERPMEDPVLFDPDCPLGARVCADCLPVLERRITAVKAARDLIEEG